MLRRVYVYAPCHSDLSSLLSFLTTLYPYLRLNTYNQYEDVSQYLIENRRFRSQISKK